MTSWVKHRASILAIAQIINQIVREEVIKIQIILVVSMDVARALHQRGPATAEAEELSRAVEALGATLKSMHPGVEDPGLMKYFIVEAPDPATTQHTIDRLRQLKVVEAAYLKPPDELPL